MRLATHTNPHDVRCFRAVAFKKATMALCLGLVVAVGTACDSKSEKEREREKAGGQAAATPAAKVSNDGSIRISPQQVQANGIQTVALREETLASAVDVVGRVQAQPGHESDVTSPFAGRLVTLGASLPTVGGFVRQGQVLAEVEQYLTAPERTQTASQITQFEATATQAQQEVDLLRVELERAKQLFEGGAIPQKQYQTAEFSLRQAETRLQSARESVAQFRALLSQEEKGPRRISITAPITGTVMASNLTAGMQMDPAKSLMKIVDLRTVWVQAAVPESTLGAIRKTSQSEITSPALPGRIYRAALVTVGPAVDPANRTIPLIYAVNNGDGALKIDMTANIRIPTGSSATALLVPSSAVLYGAGQSMVFVELERGSYQRRSVITGESRGRDIVVLSGLKPDERVVATGAETLRSELLRGDIPSEEGEKP